MTTNADAAPRRPSADELRALAAELDVTAEQLDEAIAAVGPNRSDIELHLKGSRSSTNSDRVRDAGG